MFNRGATDLANVAYGNRVRNKVRINVAYNMLSCRDIQISQ